MERRYGANYTATKDMTTVNIAKHLRKVITQSKKDGLIPDYKYSVTSNVRSIRIKTIHPTHLQELASEFYAGHDYNFTAFYAVLEGKYAELLALANTQKMLKELLDSYNWDGSDIMTDYFDVRFYGFVDMESEKSYASWHPAKHN